MDVLLHCSVTTQCKKSQSAFKALAYMYNLFVHLEYMAWADDRTAGLNIPRSKEQPDVIRAVSHIRVNKSKCL